MAKSKGRSGGSRRGGSKPAAPARKAAAVDVIDDIEVVEEEGGLGMDDGIVFITTLMLLVGFLMLDYNRGKNYGEGLLFKGKYEAPSAAAVAPE